MGGPNPRLRWLNTRRHTPCNRSNGSNVKANWPVSSDSNRLWAQTASFFSVGSQDRLFDRQNLGGVH